VSNLRPPKSAENRIRTSLYEKHARYEKFSIYDRQTLTVSVFFVYILKNPTKNQIRLSQGIQFFFFRSYSVLSLFFTHLLDKLFEGFCIINR